MQQLDVPDALREVERLVLRAAEAEEPLLAEMVRKMVGGGGKRMRPRILLLAHAACGGGAATTQVLEAAAGMELIHTATLVHDDIIDDGDRRRGQASTQREYGLERAVVVGDYLFIRGFELSARQDAEVVRLTAQACTRLAEGELLEIEAMRSGALDLERYLRIIECKTAAPLEACGRVGAHLAGRDDLQQALGDYGKHLGLAFQVSDDLLDLRGDPAVTGKPRATDLRTGAPNAPVLLARTNGARVRLESLLGKKVRTEADIEAAVEVILASGAVAEAERLAREHGARAVEALAAVPEGPARRELADLARGLARRVA